MGIYDNAIDFGGDNAKKAVIGILAIIVIIAAVFAITSITNFGPANPLEIRFAKNPIKPTEMTSITVKLTNNTENDLTNVPVAISAKEKTDLDIFPENSEFDGIVASFSKGTTREVRYILNPVGNVLPGTYVIVAKTTMNGKEFEKEEILTVN